MQLTIRKTWNVNGTPTNATVDHAGRGPRRHRRVVLAAGTAMPAVATGVYEYTLPAVDGGTTYTATIMVVGTARRSPRPWSACRKSRRPRSSGPTASHDPQSAHGPGRADHAQPEPDLPVHGHTYSKGEYLEILGRQIEQFTKLNAQAHPFEIVTRGN